MGRKWTDEQKQKQREAIKRWQPWTKSTGPQTDTGKRTSSHNALKHGRFDAGSREDRRLISQILRDTRALISFGRAWLQWRKQQDKIRKLQKELLNTPHPNPLPQEERDSLSAFPSHLTGEGQDGGETTTFFPKSQNELLTHPAHTGKNILYFPSPHHKSPSTGPPFMLKKDITWDKRHDMTAEPKKLYIKSYGCQMNVYDTKRMQDILRPLGYAAAETPDDADMVILNTCHIREKATDKVFSDLGRVREHKIEKEKNGGQMVVAVAGCVAQAEGDVILSRAKHVDMVFGPQTYHNLPEMVAKITGAYGHARVINTDFPVEEKFDYLPQENAADGPSAHLSIQEGCDKFCTFCVVPYTRGSEYSRNVQSVMDEAKRLVDNGVRDITLLGQNVNAFHGTGPDGSTWGLGQLIAKLADINGLERIRYTTSHPCDVQDDLIDAHASVKKLMPYLHLPVQSGSDKILKAMNRKHTTESYMKIMARFKQARPDIVFSSDFIVGFPGETEEDFEATIDLVRAIGFGAAYSFKYSARPGTPAANMTNLVREDVKDARLQRLQALLTEQAIAFNQNFIGQTVPVLVDGKNGKRGHLHGRTPHNQAISFTGPDRLYGQIIDVTVNSAGQMALHGEIKLVDAA